MDYVVDVCEIPQVLTVPNHGLHLPRSRLLYNAWEEHRVGGSKNPGRPDGNREEPIHTVGLQDELLRLGLGLGVVVEGLHRGGFEGLLADCDIRTIHTVCLSSRLLVSASRLRMTVKGLQTEGFESFGFQDSVFEGLGLKN
jgi:hypothetical protein